VPLDDDELLALRTIATRDQKSVSELLHPVVVRYIKSRLKRDPDLAASVEALQRSRERPGIREGASVTPLSARGRKRPRGKGMTARRREVDGS
jgi:hypothetical protein